MDALLKRDEIDAKYKWRLEDIYASDDIWEEDFRKLKSMLPQIEGYRGKLSSADGLYSALKLRDEISQLAERLFTYARMRRDEDNANGKYQALADRAMGLMVEVQSALAFIVPEILSVPADELYGYIQQEKGLELYRHYLDELIRQKAHVLSANEEQILAQAGEMAEAPDMIFTMINDADIKFPFIKDENGNDVELTKGRYIQFMESYDRRVRQNAFEALYDTYGRYRNTLAATLGSNVKKDIFFSRVRKYPSSLEASLDDDNVPVSVYNGLIDAIHRNMELMYRYVRLRKRMLGLDELHMYDLYVPLVPDLKVKMSYEDAVAKVLEGLHPLGDEYRSILEQGFEGSWIDVYENQGKTSGAYSWGCYGVHPYVLLNFQGTLDDIFTIAHEMGHALHTYYSHSSQPYIYAGYRIFVAEVASTLNEALLMDHMLKTTDDRNMKMYLINHYLEQFRGTVYRQTMFAEFERIIHEMAEAGQSLTPDRLCSIYHDLNVKYYGPDIVVDDRIDMEWARIPHFYSSFYVYKYATGFSAATALSQQILNEGKSAVERYINFLKSGGSDYPIELLKKAGVDMTTPEPVEQALAVFAGLIDQMESMI